MTMGKLRHRFITVLAVALLLLPVAPSVVHAKKKSDTSQTATIQNVVYITKTGHKFHKAGCRYLKYSRTEIDRDEALRLGYVPCKVCRP